MFTMCLTVSDRHYVHYVSCRQRQTLCSLCVLPSATDTMFTVLPSATDTMFTMCLTVSHRHYVHYVSYRQPQTLCSLSYRQPQTLCSLCVLPSATDTGTRAPSPQKKSKAGLSLNRSALCRGLSPPVVSFTLSTRLGTSTTVFCPHTSRGHGHQ